MSETETIGRTREVAGIVTAESPIHTGGDEKTGNQTLLRRQKMYLPDKGRIEEIPYVAGNSVRGHLRRLFVSDFLDRIDYTLRDERLYHALYSGGMLQKGDKHRIDADLRRDIRRVPAVNLFGMSFENQMLASVLNVGHMLPVCRELAPRTKEVLNREPEIPVAELLDFQFQTRKDEEPDNTGLDVDFDPAEDDDENDQAMQMKYEVETFIPGTRFLHSFKLESHASPIDASALHHAIDLWSQEGTVGGMSASGFGEISLNYGDHDDVERAEMYLEYVEEFKDELIEVLDEVSRK